MNFLYIQINNYNNIVYYVNKIEVKNILTFLLLNLKIKDNN